MPFPLVALAIGTAIGGAGIGAGIAASNLKGENHSEQLNKFITKNIIDASINFVSENSNEIDLAVQADNEIFFDAEGITMKNCTIQIKQENNVKVRGNFVFTNELQAKFRRDIANAVELALDNFNEQENEKLNFGQSNASIVKNEALTENIIDVSQQFVLSFTNVFIGKFSAKNRGVYNFKNAYIECPGGLRAANDLPFFNTEQINNIDIDIEQVVRNTNVIDSITSLTNNTIYKVTNVNIQKNTGVDPLSFLGMLAGLGIFLSIAAAVIKVLIKKAGDRGGNKRGRTGLGESFQLNINTK